MTVPMTVQMKVLNERIRELGLPSYGSDKAAGLDLRACLEEPVSVAPGQTVMVPTGIALHIDDPDYAGFIYARSGLGAKTGLVPGNLVGVIDADYQGEVMVAAWNRNRPDAQPVTINPGDRIAQMVIGRVQRIVLEEVNAFETSVRGVGGFGSTGVA
ncbi:Deoxyuridine 5'-triphosphate nucleotidohydrolase [Caenispirillum salinarum AK4]|uniref:Deoxyuridine 5'-triphosphate nucleotidohydrolase n=1 Tax=Caenispirillum salinarum AK4 TaxID=1238182 RepID=K9GSJ4_9PROT|nr:dUTP diphosphatase [Caenispirillum salinarum]EKV27704.1 Deoxyuridine 5'-triphosphate nucleotidohydrolase [Caenispirillum salinarum AK4]